MSIPLWLVFVLLHLLVGKSKPREARELESLAHSNNGSHHLPFGWEPMQGNYLAIPVLLALVPAPAHAYKDLRRAIYCMAVRACSEDHARVESSMQTRTRGFGSVHVRDGENICSHSWTSLRSRSSATGRSRSTLAFKHGQPALWPTSRRST